MSLGSCRRVVFSSMVILFIVSSLLHVWLCCHCQAGAIRIFPGNQERHHHQQMKVMPPRRESNEDLFRKFFNGRSFGLNPTAAKGFDDIKRRVPSCPDPLHNK